jgi:hypothetical protein
MKRIIALGLVLIVCFGCTPQKTQSNKTTVEIQQNSKIKQSKDVTSREKLNFEVIENTNILHFNDENIIASIEVEYFPESDVVKNIEMFKQKDKYYELFNKPFKNTNLNISHNNPKSANEILKLFNIGEYDINDLSQVGTYKTIKISLDGINLYLLKVGTDSYAIFFIEVLNDSIEYQSTIALDSSQEDVIQILGEPNFFTKDRNAFIYTSLNELMQINVLFNNNKIEKLQYLFWDGV